MPELKSVDIGLESTIMAIREELMNYFKGSCVERFTTNRNVKLNGLSNYVRFDYQRRECDRMQQVKILSVGSLPLMRVSKSPFKVTFHTAVLNRSPQLRAVRQGVEDFLDEFLPSVEKEEHDAHVIYE